MKRSLLFIVLFLISVISSKAGHINGGELTYRYVGNSADPNKYEITLVIHFEISTTMLPPSQVYIDFSSSCFPANVVTLPLVDGPVKKAYTGCVDSLDFALYLQEEYIYKKTVSLPGPCQDWRFEYTVCCRSTETANLNTSAALHITAILNNTAGINNSPEFIDRRREGLCINTTHPIILKQRATDQDGDSLHYSWGQPMSGTAQPILFAPGYSKNFPIKSSPAVNLDDGSGIITVKPIQEEDVVLKLNVEEYRLDPVSGMWMNIGRISREFLITVLEDCSIDSGEVWQLSTEPDSLNSNITINCGDTLISLYSDLPIEPNSLSPSSTEFRVIVDSIAVPVIGTSITELADAKYRIDIETMPITRNGLLHLEVRKGMDGNSLISECGFHLPSPSVIAGIVQGCSTVGVKENSKEVKIFPNPVNTFLHLPSMINQNGTAKIFDLRGKLLWQIELDSESIDVSGLDRGTYVLRIITDDAELQHVFIKE